MVVQSDRIRMIFRYAVEGDSVREVCVQAEKHLSTFTDVRAADYIFTHVSFEGEMAIRWYLAALKAELLLEPKPQTAHNQTRTLARQRERDRLAPASNDHRGILERSQRLLSEARDIVRQLSLYAPDEPDAVEGPQ